MEPVLDHRTCPKCPNLIAGAGPPPLCFMCLGPDHVMNGISSEPPYLWRGSLGRSPWSRSVSVAWRRRGSSLPAGPSSGPNTRSSTVFHTGEGAQCDSETEGEAPRGSHGAIHGAIHFHGPPRGTGVPPVTGKGCPTEGSAAAESTRVGCSIFPELTSGGR